MLATARWTWPAGSSLVDLPGLDRLRFEPWEPVRPVWLDGAEPIWDVIRTRDRMLHHPYESFDAVVHLLKQAADDPDVLAIKMTLYRVSRESPIVAALGTGGGGGQAGDGAGGGEGAASTRSATWSVRRSWSGRARSSCTASPGTRCTRKRS